MKEYLGLLIFFASIQTILSQLGILTESLEYSKQCFNSFADWATAAKMCQYKSDMVGALNESLFSRVKGQDEGLTFILNAFSSWEFQKSSGVQEPLVLAITGPTGVGKSETAFRIGEALFQNGTIWSSQRDNAPPCLVFLKGEDYTEAEATSIGVGGVQKLIKTRVVEHITRCNGNAVVVIDEIQKIAPGALSVLMPGLEERGSFTTVNEVKDNYYDTIKRMTVNPPSTIQTSTANVVFIFISDIAAEPMTRMLLIYGDRSLIPKNELRQEVKASLDKQWSRLKLGKVINEVVPFLPLEPIHIKDILKDKLNRIAIENKFKYWSDLRVNDDVIEYMVGPTFIKYSVHSPIQKAYAVEGGLVCSEDNASCSTGNENNDESFGTKSKIFADYGARSLVNAGPLQDLRSMWQRFARPWRVDKVLHIGMLSTLNRDLVETKWGSTRSKSLDNQIYFQWCSFNDSDAPLVVTDSIAFSDSCETVWFGPFPS